MIYTTRIFDLNKDGYVDKKEFKWMTTNSKIDHEKVDLLFEVSSHNVTEFNGP